MTKQLMNRMFDDGFHCPSCNHICATGSTNANDRELWKLVFDSNTFIKVKCPGCKTELIQCCHCPKNFITDDCGRKRKRKRSAEGMMKEHVNGVHFKLGKKGASQPCDTVDHDASTIGQNDDFMPSNEGNDEWIPEDDVAIQTACVHPDENREHEAEEFTQWFVECDLDPDKVNVNHRDMEEEHHVETEVGNVHDNYVRVAAEYSYNDFSFFDWRKKEEKTMQGSSVERTSQVQIYFYQKYRAKLLDINDNTGGFRGLVGRSNVRDREDTRQLAHPKETSVMFRFFDLIMTMTESQQEKMVDYQMELFQLLGFQGSEHVRTRFPTSYNELRSAITKGANSILKNFPVQQVFEIGNHACVSLKETVLLMAGHGADYNFGIDGKTGERNNEGLNGTEAMTDLIEEVRKRMEDSGIDHQLRIRTSIGWLLFWSDSFLRCFIKQKDNSIWILTVTICPPEGQMSSRRYTIVLAMGKSSEDHTPVIEHYMRELSEMMKGFDCYFGSSNKIQRIAFGMVAWNADRPENQMLTCTRKEGTYGKVTGYAVKPSEQHLPACIACYVLLIKKMVKKMLVQDDADARRAPTTCQKCCNWNLGTEVNGDETNLHYDDNTSKDYPKEYVGNELAEPLPEGREGGLTVLGPIKLTTEWMLKAVRYGYFGVHVGGWSKAVAEEYFKTCNIKTSTGVQVFEQAKLDKSRRIYNPAGVEPPFWKLIQCFGRFKFPNLPMHGVAHGMIPDVMDIIHQIFSKYGKAASFYNYANTVLGDVATFRLDYLKPKALPKAAWVSENSMGFMRLMSYLYGTFLMNNTLGNSEEGKATANYIKCMVNSFQAYVSILMTQKSVPKTVIENHMKLFMSSAHYLHKKHGNLDKKKNDENGPGQKKSCQPKFLDQQSLEALKAIARNLGLSTSGSSVKVMVGRIRKLTIRDIREKMQEPLPPQNTPKDELIKLIYAGIDGVDISGTSATVTQQQSETMCWNRGNWVSFMANISEQIEYLGPLHLIW